MAGDQFGYAVAISGNSVLLGAPQLDGSPGLAIDTAGAGFVFTRSVAPPTTVTQPVRADILLNGAQANFISGTLGSTSIPTFNFFDILDVGLRTGSSADKVTITEPGLTALGLRNFTIATGGGNDGLDVQSTHLTPPGLGSFDPSSPGGPLYVPALGRFKFDGGADNDTVTVAADADWSLRGDRIVVNDRQTLELGGVEAAEINGGDSGNVLEVTAWAGSVTLDGRGGSDQIRVYLGDTPNATVQDSDGSADQLTVLGTDAAETISVFQSFGQSLMGMGAEQLVYSGVDLLRIAALGGDAGRPPRPPTPGDGNDPKPPHDDDDADDDGDDDGSDEDDGDGEDEY